MSVSSEASDTHLSSQHLKLAEPVRGKIKISWKEAVLKALTNWKDFALKSIIVASVASILRMLQGFVFQGFVLWISFASLIFVIHVSEHARLQRKESRYEHPSISSTEKEDN